jgi:Tfp pilus assembly protein PilX
MTNNNNSKRRHNMSAINYNVRGNERGVVLIVCLILLLMLSLIGIASITTSNSDMQVAGNEMKQTGAFYAAESGVERSAASIATSYETSGSPPSPLPSGTLTQSNFQYAYSTTDNGAPVQTTLTDGAYRNLYGLVKTFNITSSGIDYLKREAGATVNMQMRDALIPLFQFAVYYENDLEIAPGPNMTLGGRVHSNHNIYLQSDNNINIDSYLTSAGDILHGRKPGSGQGLGTGNVFIKDNNGNYQNMKNTDGTWLDSGSPNWVNNSLSRWGGLVEDANHGITQLDMPVVRNGATTNLIDRAGGGNNDSFQNKASLTIIDGTVMYLQSNGTWANVTSTFTSQGIMTSSTFRDNRENKNVNSVDINIGLLASKGYYPRNGIIYCSQTAGTTTINAYRLKNATTLQAALTVATNNPLYTVGNFNTTNKKPACLIADAITVLSNSWNDANSQKDLSQRIATATQVNACYIAGNSETGAKGQGYNGGFENLVRFQENWDGISFTWRGSASNLWYSRQTAGAWGGSYYSPPNRDWAFDTALLDIANLPPGTPYVNIIQRSSWSQSVYRP